jgi:hypothetical protein
MMRGTGFCRRSFIALTCLSISLLAVINGTVHVAIAQQAEFQNRLAQIAAKHGLNRVWFRAARMAKFWLTLALAWIVACDSMPNAGEREQIADEVRALVDDTAGK